ncbi:BrnA antitoxin family protein [Xanthobacter oligotrophicus]|uniref:BrnA antitoxin family protein n=1 Tax=Xanthobacter oligotrophicus TaxID=2607286 RepID=UPI0011F39181|nr:BrnA antitoxin family protein [Xanthobacter oligotrophicus]MCG5236121.1 BrnA antitoxin family protein [Xanthobacter oligotrophicus]
MASRKRKQFEPGHGYTQPDWDAVSDAPEATEAELAQARPFAEAFPDLAEAARRVRGPQRTPTKVPVSIRLSRDVVEYFKAGGPGWQARIDDALRRAVAGKAGGKL